MNFLKATAILTFTAIAFISCSKKDDQNTTVNPPPASPKLIFKFKFDSSQVRLNSFGQPATMPAGHSGQSPKFNLMSAHYIELASGAFTPLGSGTILYRAPETTLGGNSAIDFDSSKVVGEGQTFYSTAISNVTPGTYNWLRISLAYQNYDINYRFFYLGNPIDNSGTVASFIGFNTYIRSYHVNDSVISVNANRLQGYWAFETSYSGFGSLAQGQAPPGATTVPNPLFATSSVPQGSCVVTGAFTSSFTITGNETHDVVVTVSLSTNKSFEWTDFNTNGIYEPLDGDTVIDMGVRGLIPVVTQ